MRLPGADEPAPPHAGGAQAVALDDRGLVAAYATGPAIRLDYLDAAATGPRLVAVTESLAIDIELAEITALAFDPTSRMIACVSSTNAVDIVPVL